MAAAPFDPAPMLIHAGWLKERGDLAGAEVLRGLAAAGYASLAGLACMLAAKPRADEFRYEYRPPHDSAVGYGRGDEYGDRAGYGEAEGLDDLEEAGGYGEGLVGIDAAELPG